MNYLIICTCLVLSIKFSTGDGSRHLLQIKDPCEFPSCKMNYTVKMVDTDCYNQKSLVNVSWTLNTTGWGYLCEVEFYHVGEYNTATDAEHVHTFHGHDVTWALLDLEVGIVHYVQACAGFMEEDEDFVRFNMKQGAMVDLRSACVGHHHSLNSPMKDGQATAKTAEQSEKIAVSKAIKTHTSNNIIMCVVLGVSFIYFLNKCFRRFHSNKQNKVN